MIPTVGRIVLYTNLGDRDGRFPPEAQAALITKVVDEWAPGTAHAPGEEAWGADDERRYRVSLRVFYEDGEFTMRGVPFTNAAPASEDARGKWTWPPRV